MQTAKAQPSLQRRLRDQGHPSREVTNTPVSNTPVSTHSQRLITTIKATIAHGEAGLRRGLLKSELPHGASGWLSWLGVRLQLRS